MLNQIVQFIIENKFTLLIPILFATVLLLLDTFSNRNRLSIVGLILFALALAGFIVIIIKDIKILKIDLALFVAAVALLSFFYNSGTYAKASYRYNKIASLIIALPSNVESQIYMYLDTRSRLLIYTRQFYALFADFNMDKKNWHKYLSHVVINNSEYNYKQFLKYLSATEEQNYKIEFVFNNEYIVPVQLNKQKVTDSGKLLGYVMINQVLTLSEIYKETVNNEYRKRQHIYLDLLGEPIMYYDFVRNRYILNSLMCRLLGIEENELPIAVFEQLMHEEDKKALAERQVHSDRVERRVYRLRTINGYDWFEESAVEFENRQYVVLYRTDFSTVKLDYYNYVNLIDDLKAREDFNFILIMIAIRDIPEITEKAGKDGCEIVVSKYFRNLASYTGETRRIYKVGQIEYALVMDDGDKFDLIVRDLENGTSGYLGDEINLNEARYILRNAVGIVKSQTVVVQTAESVVKAGFDALNLASDEKYMKRYSVYQAKKPVEDPSHFNIDLSDDFLDKLLKE